MATAAPLRLHDALARAREASPAIQAATAELEATRAGLRQAGLVPVNPVLAGELARHTEPGGAELDRGVSLAQEVEVGGQRGLRVSTARHDVARAESALADRRRAVDGEVRRAFAGLAAAGQRRALAVDQLGLAHRLLETARRRARAGDVGTLDMKLGEIEVARAAQALAAAESERVRAAARLGTAIGADPREVLVPDETEADPGTLPAENELMARALAVRPDLVAAREEHARLASAADLVRRRGRIPNPTLKGFYRQELQEEHIAGGEITVPLPIWNREQGTEAALGAAASAAHIETERLTREIPRQIQVALARRAAATEAWVRYRHDALPAAASARDLIERAYVGGYLGLPEVLVQQDRLLQVRAAAISAWLDLREADADVIEAVGEEDR